MPSPCFTRRELWRRLSALVASTCTAAGAMQKDATRGWKNAVKINDQYDWLRPPDPVFLRAVDLVHTGKISRESFAYSYTKGFSFETLYTVVAVEFRTPISQAAALALDRRTTFGSKPTIGELAPMRDQFFIFLLSEASIHQDVPSIALDPGTGPIAAKQVETTYRDWSYCTNMLSLTCRHTGRFFSYAVPAATTLRGSGTLVVRWHDWEKQVPISLDHLW